MIGHFLALLSATGFSGNGVYTRKAVFRLGEPNATFYISIFLGTIVFSLALAFSGKAEQLTTASWYALASLVGSGITGFVIGRWFDLPPKN
jgi:drug/metabolite transporter (DMT)-like permease